MVLLLFVWVGGLDEEIGDLEVGVVACGRKL